MKLKIQTITTIYEKGEIIMRRLYGYELNLQPICEVNEGEAQVVQLIYQSYIDGLSLGGIAKLLKSKNISSSSGNDTWGRAAIDKLLSNDKYVPYIIAHDTFHAAQCEKQRKRQRNHT